MLRDDAVILLAVKPQMLPEVAGDLAGLLRGTGRSVLSILAGVTTAGVRASVERAGDGVGVEGWTGGVMRAMPNTPASVGKGATALASPRDVSSAQASAARDLLAPLGELYELDESQIDAFTAIAGSGPAYVFRFIEALAAAGRELGLPTEAAGRIAAATVVGAATLLEHDGGDPGGLREAVTSRGGTTAAALDSLNAADFVGIVGRAAAAAAKRAEELGQARE
jgi:pyrroline-5-carboxylate reductase